MLKLTLCGYHIDEYQEMFDLSSQDLDARFLEYGCGPTAVNAELHKVKKEIISYDPVFSLSKIALEQRIKLAFNSLVTKITRNHMQFDFTRYGSLDGFIQKKREGLVTFLTDYEQGKIEQRYQARANYTPVFSFDFALSAHYFFTNLKKFNLDAHLQTIKDLASIAKEVRIFPLIDSNGKPSALLGPVLLNLQQSNFGAEVRNVPYTLQKSGNAMLRVWAQQCKI